MSLQYTYDADGKPIGVFIPINEWEDLTNQLKKNKPMKKVMKKNIIKSVRPHQKLIHEL
jgi:hypothetical protein